MTNKKNIMTLKEFDKASKEFTEIFGFKPQTENRPLLSLSDWNIGFTTLKKLNESIPNYDGDACTYKGKPNYSLRMAIREEYGTEAEELVMKMFI